MYATGGDACQAWGGHTVQREAGSVRLQCSSCGHPKVRAMTWLPLFIVTEPGGVGKTSVVHELHCLTRAGC
jgi:hypothetical protein